MTLAVGAIVTEGTACLQHTPSGEGVEKKRSPFSLPTPSLQHSGQRRLNKRPVSQGVAGLTNLASEQKSVGNVRKNENSMLLFCTNFKHVYILFNAQNNFISSYGH